MSTTLLRPEVFGVGAVWQDCLSRLYSKRLTATVKRRIRFVHHWSDLSDKTDALLFLVTSLDEIDAEEVLPLRRLHGRPKRWLVFGGGLPLEAVVNRTASLDVRSPRSLHLTRVQGEAGRLRLIERMLTSMAMGGQAQSIVDAWWEGDDLVILSPSFDRLRIPCQAISALRNASRDKRSSFQIQEDGAYLHWPDLDLHMSWDAFAQAVDLKARLKAQQQSEEFNARYGKAIEQLRKSSGLRQSDMPGLSERQVGRIERGECRATLASLEKLAAAHNLSVSEYMSRLADVLTCIEKSEG